MAGTIRCKRDGKRAGFGGNKPFSRGHLYRILSNPIYVGLLPHRGENYPSQHPAIVDLALWDQVQQRLETNRQGKKTQSTAAAPSLLSGKLFDETGRRLIPSHRRYPKRVARKPQLGPTLDTRETLSPS